MIIFTLLWFFLEVLNWYFFTEVRVIATLFRCPGFFKVF